MRRRRKTDLDAFPPRDCLLLEPRHGLGVFEQLLVLGAQTGAFLQQGVARRLQLLPGAVG